MKTRTSISCLKAVCFLLFVWPSATLIGQINFDGIYIQEFELVDGKQGDFTEKITAQYRMVLDSVLDVKIMNRTNPQLLERLKDNEIQILEGENGKLELSKDMATKLREIGVSLIVEGRIEYIDHQGNYLIRVKYSNIFTKEQIYENEMMVAKKEVSNHPYLRQQMRMILPDKSRLPFNNLKQPINADFLNHNDTPWQSFQNVYFEDFSNYQSQLFLAHIWTLNNTKQCWNGVKAGRYVFDIKKNGLTRHKYLESEDITLNTQAKIIPYSVVVEIEDTSKCYSSEGCYGRGLTVRYNKEAQTCYSYTLTDDGDLKFMKVGDIYDPLKYQVLHSQRIKITKGKRYMLGIICLDDHYYLYLDNVRVKVISDASYQKGWNGVIAHGIGVHKFDDITIYSSYFIKQ